MSCNDIPYKEIIALIALGWTIYSYFNSKNKELKWKRTEFLFNQAQYLDTDIEIQKAVMVMADQDNKIKISSLFNDEGEIVTKENSEYLNGFEKLFNLLDRVSYAFEANVIEKDELKNFEWYLHQIKENKNISKYCIDNGFESVVKLAKEK